MKDKSLKEKLHLAKLGVMASIPEAILFCNSVIVCAAEAATEKGASVTKKINDSSMGIWGTTKVVCISLLVVVLAVCGLILVVGTQKMKESVKENFYSIVIGCMVLFLAKDIADYLQGIFG